MDKKSFLFDVKKRKEIKLELWRICQEMSNDSGGRRMVRHIRQSEGKLCTVKLDNFSTVWQHNK
ncbi:CLUMA_CG002305, isoform A [Clunio marinus]|uniref:CLUMA_CG002305, isoform A n=1 Tax=Clunio marinus TaxID=568069 RepID=A0A1J1HM53_9DIPT|nr:CLUMA_CG002305, isoform A [Clunio marinus]